MKYKLSHPVMDERMRKAAAREVRRQRIYVATASKKHLKEIAAVTKAIEKDGLPKNLVLRKLPGALGHGIFLHPKAEPILRGQVIGPYSGELSLVSQEEADDSPYAFELLGDVLLTKSEQAHFDPHHRYQPKRTYSFLVDAIKKGNFIRFINHSEKPNIVASFFKIPSNSYGLAPMPIEVIYMAKKKILPGEQLLVSYEGDDNSYWSALEVEPIPITPQTFRLNTSLKVYKSPV